MNEPEQALIPEIPGSVLERLRAGLTIMALRTLGDREAAGEAAQECLVRLVAALRDGRARSDNASAFAFGIARHVLADTLRIRGRVAEGAVRLDDLPHADPGALADLVTREERDRVRRALAEIPPADREILRLAFYEGLRSREIASRLGEPGERVRKRKQRAIERLRRAFLGSEPQSRNGISRDETEENA